MSSTPKAGVLKTPTTVDSVRRPVTVKSSVSRVLPSSKIATPGMKVLFRHKAGVLKTPTSKDTPFNIPARRESAALKKSASATKGKVQEPRAPLKQSGSAAVKSKCQNLVSNNQVLAPSSSPVAPATTSHATDSTSRPSEALQGVAGQPMSPSSSLEALKLHTPSNVPSSQDIESKEGNESRRSPSEWMLHSSIHSLGDLRNPMPSLDSMSWLDCALDGVISQPLSSSSSLEALDAAVQLHSLGDLRDPLLSTRCHGLTSVAELQPSSLDDLRGLLPSLDLMSFLHDDAIPVPPFKSLGQNKDWHSVLAHGYARDNTTWLSGLFSLGFLSFLSPLSMTEVILGYAFFVSQPNLPPVVVRVNDYEAIQRILTITATARDACISGELHVAKELLTQEIHADANKSITILPSLTGCICKGIALCGKGKVRDAIKAFDIASMFTNGDPKTNHFLLLTKANFQAITLFNADQHEEAIQRVQELADMCPNSDTLACRVVGAYLHVCLGIDALDGAHYDEAADHFAAAVKSCSFSSTLHIHHLYEDFVVLSSKNAARRRRLTVYFMEIPGQDQHDGIHEAERDFFGEMYDVSTTTYALFLAHTSFVAASPDFLATTSAAPWDISRDSSLSRIPLAQLPHQRRPPTHPLPPLLRLQNPPTPPIDLCGLFTQQRHSSSTFLSHRAKNAMLRRALPVIRPMAM
ncbi:hypothetical protein DFH29DRAFT_1084603 [Suillus ampliporus]|nr:hypothetical protein DFH29DRAFT_1084603 [Suillus ampliporus]